MVKKVSFYSYKGGCGRSLSLANIAFDLARKGKKVGAIELDIGAPGLMEILNLKAKPRKSVSSLLIDPNAVDLSNAVVDVSESLNVETSGKFYLIPALKENIDEVENITWTQQRVEEFTDGVIDPFSKFYDLDYIFIDCRSGISGSSLTGLVFGDVWALFTRLDRQGINGTSYILNDLMRDNSSTPYFIVVTGFTGGDLAKLSLSRFEKNINRKLDYVLPYDENLAINEEIVVLRRGMNDPIRVAYENLTEKEFMRK